MTDHSGTTAPVTGSGQGIMRAIAEDPARAGARIAVQGPAAHNVTGTATRVDVGWTARQRAARSAAMPPGHSPPIARRPPCSAASGTLHRSI